MVNMFSSTPSPLFSRPNEGLLISLEGCSGAGKTYTMKKISQKCKNIMLISEISDNKDGFIEGLKTTLLRLNKEEDIFFLEIPPIPTLFLLISLYVYNYENVIIPALAKNKIVVMDRGIDSPALLQSILHLFISYNQEIAINLYSNIISKITSFVFPPDITYILDEDFTTCIERTQHREQRILNKKELLFLQRVRLGFRAISYTDNRFCISNTNDIIKHIKALDRNYKNGISVS